MRNVVISFGCMVALVLSLGGCGLNGTDYTPTLRTAVYAYGFFYKRIFDQIHGNDADDVDTSADYSLFCAGVEDESIQLPSGCRIENGCETDDDKKTVEVYCQLPVDNGEGLPPDLHDSTEICGTREGLQAMPTNRAIFGFKPDNVTRTVTIKFDGDIWWLPAVIQKVWIAVNFLFEVEAGTGDVSVDCDYADYKFEVETGEETMDMEPVECSVVKPVIETFINDDGQCPTN